MKASTLAGALVFVSFTGAFTPIAPAATNDVHVGVENITDMRSSRNSTPRCNLQLSFSGGDVADAYGIREIRITTAMDDTGHDLRLDSDQDKARRRIFQSNGYTYQGTPFTPQTGHSVELISPAREAHSIKVLEGEAELLFPTPENGGLIIVKDFLAHPGEAFSDPLLKKSNVNITYIGKEGDEPPTSNRTVQTTAPSPSNRTVQASAPSPADSAPAVRRFPFRRDSRPGNSLRFSVDDPDHRLADMTFMDAYGRQVWAGLNSVGDASRTYQFQKEIPSNLRLYIYLATPDSIKTVHFKIENIELP